MVVAVMEKLAALYKGMGAVLPASRVEYLSEGSAGDDDDDDDDDNDVAPAA